jgi:hypothetical protein
MGAFIERSADGLSPEQYTEAASSYAEAMMLLYRNDRGEQWYAKALPLIRISSASCRPTPDHTGISCC